MANPRWMRQDSTPLSVCARSRLATSSGGVLMPNPHHRHSLTPIQHLLCLNSMRQLLFQCTAICTIVIATTVASAESPDTSSLQPRTGRAIQSDSPLPMNTKRGRCNPASTRCQLPRHRVQPTDSDLNQRTEAGARLQHESSLNTRSRAGASIDNP